MKRTAITAALGLALALALAAPLPAEEFNSTAGCFIDLPEGCALDGGDGSTRFSFGFPFGDLRLDLLEHDASRYAAAKAGADDVARQLGARASAKSFVYQRRDASLGEFSITSKTADLRGFLLVVDCEAGKDYVLLAYGPSASFDQFKDAMLSSLDGFSVDAEARTYPGPVSQYAYAWNPSLRKPVDVAYGGAKLRVPYDPKESLAAQELVEREYRVLGPYGAKPALIEAAVRRFYRAVFRECARRLDPLALEISRRHELGLPSPDAFKPAAYAAELLAWVQGFKYERGATASDVVNPLAAGYENRGDCDSRALLVAALLRFEGVEAIAMISLAYEHALVAVDAEGAGARFPFEGKKWLVGETTAKVALGQIAKDQSDLESWFGVRFPL